MKCSKPSFVYRLLVENLESRLQPGSMITGQGYGWSLLADNLSILNRDSLDSQSLVSQSSESGKSTPTSTPVDVHSDILDLAAAARNEPASLPPSNLVDNLAAGLTNDELPILSLSGHRHAVPLAAVATPTVGQPASVVTAAGSVPQSRIGVATPAQPAGSTVVSAPLMASPTPVRSAAGHGAVPIQMITLDAATVDTFAGYQNTNTLHAVPITLANTATELGGNSGNQATINFLSYLGGSGPDSMNSVAVRNEAGANFIYVAGSFTDTTGRIDGYAAKLTDSATSVVWAEQIMGPTAAGPDTASGLALNGDNVYLAGSFADPTAAVGTDGFVAQLDATTGTLVQSGTLPNATLAAVATDPAGHVLLAGSRPDPSDANRQDVALLKVNGDLSTEIYSRAIRYRSTTQNLNASVTTGGGLIVDGTGNIYLAGSVATMGDPNNNIQAFYSWLNDAAGGPSLFGLPIAAVNRTPGPGGIGTAVAFDPAGNVVFTGSVNDNTGTPLNQDLALGRLQPTTDTFGAHHLVLRDAWGWKVDDRSGGQMPPRAGDWTGNGLVVLADGTSIVTGTAYDPAAPNDPPLSMPSNGFDVHLTHFTATDDNTVNTENHAGNPENIFGGSGTDVGNAIALDPTNPTNVYVVGSTTSADLPTTPGVAQPTYGGVSSTGFVAQASVG